MFKALDKQEEKILMEPGEIVAYSRSSGKSMKKRIENEAPASWKDGTAIMQDVALKEIIRKIREIYDVHVEVKNEADLERQFTIFLPVDNPELGYDMLKGLGFEIDKKAKTWLIH